MVERLFRGLGYVIEPAWRYSPNTLETHLAALLRMQAITCVLDVGANVGQYHDRVRHSVRFDGHVVSFEPVAANFAQLERKAPSDPRWSLFHCALGAENTRSQINVMRETQLSSFLSPDHTAVKEYTHQNDVVYREEIEVRTLADAFREIEQRAIPTDRCYLKLDTQGYDLQVLEGAKPVLDRVFAMQMEMPLLPIYKGMPSLSDGLATVSGLGFDATGLFPVARDSRLRLVELDCVFTRRAS